MIEDFTCSPDNLALLFDCVADGVYAVDQQMRLTYLNRAVEGLLGVKRSEVVGRSCREVFNSMLCAGGCPVREAMERGEPVRNWEFDLFTPDQRKVPIAGNAARLVDGRGRTIGGVMTLRNLAATVKVNRRVTEKYTFCEMVSCNPVMQSLFETLVDIAPSDASVLICGESGTGKELVARAIHQLSGRSNGPMIVVNCGALPEPLLEAEIFGVKRGAFTDAKEDRPGRLAMAEGGTLLLDEIGDLPLALQVKLLRVLENHEYQPLGDSYSRHADVRFLAATHCHMEAMVEAGTFRRDLYFRLNVAMLKLPPLKQRCEDIPLLGNLFLERFNREFGKQIVGITPEACRYIQQYSFPGNIRELMHLLEQIVIMCREPEIGVEHLPRNIIDEVDRVAVATGRAGQQRPSSEAIRAVLKANGNNRGKAAAEFGVDRTTLWRWLKSIDGDELSAGVKQ